MISILTRFLPSYFVYITSFKKLLYKLSDKQSSKMNRMNIKTYKNIYSSQKKNLKLNQRSCCMHKEKTRQDEHKVLIKFSNLSSKM